MYVCVRVCVCARARSRMKAYDDLHVNNRLHQVKFCIINILKVTSFNNFSSHYFGFS